MYVCYNCMRPGTLLPRQWEQNGLHVQVNEVPCSGKIDVQYLFHAFEGGASGVCVVGCPQGECRLAQGNYRAEIRVQMVQRLLGEIEMNPERIAIVHCSPDDPEGHTEQLLRKSVDQFATLGKPGAQAPISK